MRNKRLGTKKFGRSRKNFKPAGQSSKYWLRLRNEREKLKTGITNTLRILTAKWKLKYHRVAQSVVVAETITNDPNKLWKTRSANEKKIRGKGGQVAPLFCVGGRY